MIRQKELTTLLIKPPVIDPEVTMRNERGGMGDVLGYSVRWYLYRQKINGIEQWVWHRARLQWCNRGDVGWVPMAMAECTQFAMGDHVWHGPFSLPLYDAVEVLPCPQCVQNHRQEVADGHNSDIN